MSRLFWTIACCVFLMNFTSRRHDCHAADRLLTENPQLAQWFESQVSKIEHEQSLLKYKSREEWEAARPALRGQLFEMLGLSPLPEKTPLQTEITGITEESEFRVERVHFQSLPGLFVSGNLYIPKNAEGPLPAVLYVCGHGNVKVDDISYGSKVSYQRHGCWFARNGYVCLVIDTLQLGEIEGIHHGTYRYNRWWWNSRGYTPAGVEAWNCIRSLDFLQSRQEVDGTRIGVTGRSGGGAYSWWISALDDRIRCSVPVAGITNLRDHVINGCVEGHCDCMYMVNTYQWDYATVAALVAPRPLLISNTDKDSIFPLEGVIDIHRQVRHIYDLYKKPEHLGLQITEGPHKDTQELHVHAFRWMNRFLRNDDAMIEKLAVNFFEPEQLKVFSSLPKDERNTSIDKDFVPVPNVDISARAEQILEAPVDWFERQRQLLQTKCLAAWPPKGESGAPGRLRSVPLPDRKLPVLQDMNHSRIQFESQPDVPVAIDLFSRKDKTSTLTVVVGDAQLWSAVQLALNEGDPSADEMRPFTAMLDNEQQKGHAVAIVWARGIGPNAWAGDERKQTQILRRFNLIGTTADSMRSFDVCRALQALRSVFDDSTELHLKSTASTAMLCLVASLFEPVVSVHIAASELPIASQGTLLNQQRVIDAGEILALSLLRNDVSVEIPNTDESELARRLFLSENWTGRSLRTPAQ